MSSSRYVSTKQFRMVQKRRGRNPETHCDGLRYAILSHREISILGWYRCGYGLFRDVFSEQITFCFGNLTVPLTWPRLFVSIAGGYLSRLIGSKSKGGWKKIFVRFCLKIFLQSKIFEVRERCSDLQKIRIRFNLKRFKEICAPSMNLLSR